LTPISPNSAPHSAPASAHSSTARVARDILLLALAYVAVGRISLLLAIPPGYAMAVYPPAGIALGYVLVRGFAAAPGVTLGSFVLNLWIGWETRGTILAADMAVPAVIGIGAALQAACGAWLIRRFVGYPTALDREWHTLLFLILGGPLASLVNATVAVGALYAGGIVTTPNLVTNWATWWIGDTLGVLVLTPLILIAFGEPRGMWHSRRLNVGVPMTVSLLVVIAAFVFVRDMEQNRKYREFQEEAGRVAQTLQTRLNFHSEMVKSMERLFAASDSVTRDDFHIFVSPVLARDPTVQVLEWAPRVAHADRTAFEAAMTRESGSRVRISELRPDGSKADASVRSEYFPVDYVEPQAGNEHAIGYDLGSNVQRRAALEAARDSGKTISSEPLALLQQQDPARRTGGLLFTAVYARGMPTDTVEQRRAAFQGVVLSVVRIGNLINSIIPEAQRRQILFRITDAAAPADAATLYDTLGTEIPGALLRHRIRFGEREYTFTAQPSNEYWTAHRSWAAWWLLVGGLFFTSLLGMYLLIVSAHAFQIESLVHQRTRELHDSREKLRANATLLQTVLDSMSSCVYVRDIEGLYLYVNREYERIFGVRREDVVGRSVEDIFPPELARAYRESADLVIRERRVVHSEILVQQEDGMHTFLVVRSPLFGESGEVLGTCGVGTDITERMRSDEKLRENVALLEAVMESTSSAVVVRDADGRILYTNREYDRLFSPDGRSLVGRNISELMSASSASDFVASGRQVIDKGTTSRTEVELMRDGAALTYLLVRSPLRNERGEIYALCGVATDITQNKQIEKDMRRLNSRLEATTSLQTAILDSANFSIISTDINGIIRVFNVGAQKMLGYEAREMVGSRTPEILHDHGEIIARAEELSGAIGRKIEPGYEVLVARARFGSPDEREWTYIRKDGSRLPVMLSVTGLWNDRRELTGFLGVAYDLTERKKIEAMKNEFISTVSHELRTPLTSILGALDLLLAGAVGRLQPEMRQLLDIANDDCNRLVRLINDILDTDKIESGNMRFNLVRQRLAPLVERAVSGTQSFAAQFEVRLEVDIANDAIVNADSDRIIQVLVNLLSNAVKYSSPHSTVLVRLARHEGLARVSVIDRGEGIPEEFHDRIFDKFAQADSSDTRSKGGTGLGLSICKAIIERHRGHIDFHSVPGEGTEFHFDLPVIDVPAMAAAGGNGTNGEILS
jgi:PAS domain S-box-containing protein